MYMYSLLNIESSTSSKDSSVQSVRRDTGAYQNVSLCNQELYIILQTDWKRYIIMLAKILQSSLLPEVPGNV